MKVIARYATLEEFAWLRDHDGEIDSDLLRRKIENEELIVAESENEIRGWLRYGLFWDFIPFMNMLLVDKAMRRKGIGRVLVEFWESELRQKNHRLVMTSSQSNEDSQDFYRKLGYVDSGEFKLPNEDLEIVFYKTLG